MADSQGITLAVLHPVPHFISIFSPSPSPSLRLGQISLATRSPSSRLPAGPRTRKQTAFAQRPLLLEDTSKVPFLESPQFPRLWLLRSFFLPPKSAELQSLVSGAIRESAKGQALLGHRWRFEAHRRNMLLRALAASGADSDLLAQLSGTLFNLDLHAQDLLHVGVQRTQPTTARDTHRASALAVVLRKLNASYACRTGDLDKARALIAALRSEIDEAWKVVEEQAIQIDNLGAAALEQREKTTIGLGDSVTEDDHPDDDDATRRSERRSHHDLARRGHRRTEKAVAAQARLTMMRTDRPSV
ncbi:hypothetical protein BJV78DRAFT_1288069 [Lactifluus subvellereus]|nr:hypothetical protein BJV78DRAFT_1288069 [Lactifluus subvellereus]